MTRKTNHRALLGLALCLPVLAGCGDLFTKDLDNPVDPEAEAYQGYRTETDVDEVEAYVDDVAAVLFPGYTISAVEGADGYRLQIATDAEMTNLIYAEADGTFTDNVMRPVVNLVTGVTYYWRGAAQKYGTWGTWTDVRSFTVQGMTGLLPADGAATSDTTPSLSWTAVEGAVGYEVQVVAEGTEFPDEAGEATDTASYTPSTALANNATHEWRVRAKDAAGVYGGWSVAQALTVAFGAISGLTPADGATTSDTTPSLSWTAVEGAVDYEVRTGATADAAQAANPVSVSGATSYDYPTELADNAELHWQVRAKDAAGVYGEWSGVVMVTIVDYYTSPTIGTLKLVPAGSFQRDSTASNITTISQPFRMSEHEITRAQFLSVMGTDPSNTSYSSGTGDPVQMVNWYHAIAFCNKLSLKEGLTPVYSVSGLDLAALTYAQIPTNGSSTWNVATVNASADGYRLPTEAEWMWAAMGADTASVGATNTTGYAKPFAGSNGSNAIGDYAWYAGNSGSKTHPVGTKLPNELGLYDMSGNACEWTWDWYAIYPSGQLTDPAGATSGTYRVSSGGCWYAHAPDYSVASRRGVAPYFRGFEFGFRVVRP